MYKLNDHLLFLMEAFEKWLYLIMQETHWPSKSIWLCESGFEVKISCGKSPIIESFTHVIIWKHDYHFYSFFFLRFGKIKLKVAKEISSNPVYYNLFHYYCCQCKTIMTIIIKILNQINKGFCNIKPCLINHGMSLAPAFWPMVTYCQLSRNGNKCFYHVFEFSLKFNVESMPADVQIRKHNHLRLALTVGLTSIISVLTFCIWL